MELITKEDCQEIIDSLQKISTQFKALATNYKPNLEGERYYSGNEVCKFLNITKRTLQEYRDSRQISYIALFGKTLYKESDILALLQENYTPRLNY